MRTTNGRGSSANGASGSLIAAVANILIATAIVTLLGAAVVHFALRAKGYTFYQVATASMSPMILPGDVIATRVVEPHTIQAGDVIAFRQQGMQVPVVHRVIGVQSAPDLKSIFEDKNGKFLREKMTWAPRTFQTKGDANEHADVTPVAQAQFAGRFEFIVPGALGFLATQLGGPLMLVVGFATMGAAVIASVADALRTRAGRLAADGS